MTRRITVRVLPLALAAGLAAASCGGESEPVINVQGGGSYAPAFDPTRFAPVIDNPYLPLKTGAKWVYDGTEGGKREYGEVVVTSERRTIQGIPAVVVRDTVTDGPGGQPIEITDDWFAQDAAGNVWYLGEATRGYENGRVTGTHGSWEAGVDGARAGIVMPASPAPGQAYRQEYYQGEAEDLGQIVRVDGTASVPAGTYANVVVTKSGLRWSPTSSRRSSTRPVPGWCSIPSRPAGRAAWH